MTDLVTHAQLELLARTLHVDVERVEHLGRLGAENVYALRNAVANVIFDEHGEMFSRVSALMPVLPLSVFVPIVQKKVPAKMAGRAAGAIGVAHPDKAGPALSLMKPAYAADAAAYMDPRAVEKLADVAPHGPLIEIANEVLRRRDYAVAGMFVDYATPELIRVMEQGIQDDEGLLRAAAYVLSGKTVSSILREFIQHNPGRLPRLVTTAVNGPTDLRLATLSVLSRLDSDVIAEAGDALVETTDGALIADLVSTYLREDAAPEFLTFAAGFRPAALERLASDAMPALSADDRELLLAKIRALGFADRLPTLVTALTT